MIINTKLKGVGQVATCGSFAKIKGSWKPISQACYKSAEGWICEIIRCVSEVGGVEFKWLEVIIPLGEGIDLSNLWEIIKEEERLQERLIIITLVSSNKPLAEQKKTIITLREVDTQKVIIRQSLPNSILEEGQEVVPSHLELIIEKMPLLEEVLFEGVELGAVELSIHTKSLLSLEEVSFDGGSMNIESVSLNIINSTLQGIHSLNAQTEETEIKGSLVINSVFKFRGAPNLLLEGNRVINNTLIELESNSLFLRGGEIKNSSVNIKKGTYLITKNTMTNSKINIYDSISQGMATSNSGGEFHSSSKDFLAYNNTSKVVGGNSINDKHLTEDME